MKHSKTCVLKPQNMHEVQKDELVQLHQKYINLSRDDILSYLKNRDKLYLYYHKETKQLIATAGAQFLVCDKKVFIYIGNAVVDPRFKHEGCLPHAIMKSLISAFFRYPFKKKYWCALTSSSGSFSYAQKFQPCWPNANEATPIEMIDLMEQCIKKVGVSDYKIINGHLISYDMSCKIKGTFNTAPKNKSCMNASFFNQINPGSNQGEQLFCVSEFRAYKLIIAGIYCLHHRLINQPKLYHSLKKKRLANPLLSSYLLINTLTPKPLKWLGVFAAASFCFFNYFV